MKKDLKSYDKYVVYAILKYKYHEKTKESRYSKVCTYG